MKKSFILAGCAVFTLGLAGCGANNNAADNNRDQQVEISQVQRGPATEGTKLQLSDRAERQVEQMPEVDDARVIISEITWRTMEMQKSMMHWMATAGLLPRMAVLTRMIAPLEMME